MAALVAWTAASWDAPACLAAMWNSTFSFNGPRQHTDGCETVVVRNSLFILLGDAEAHEVWAPCKLWRRRTAIAEKQYARASARAVAGCRPRRPTKASRSLASRMGVGDVVVAVAKSTQLRLATTELVNSSVSAFVSDRKFFYESGLQRR